MFSQKESKGPQGNSKELQLKHAFAGGLAGALTRAISQPFDMIKIRFQLQVEPLKKTQNSKYTSITQAVRLVIKEEGVLGLWKGHNAGQMLSILFGLTQFWCFEELKTLANNYEFFPNNKPVTNFVCGGGAGAAAIFATSPINVVRTRLIAQDFNKAGAGYKNSFQGFNLILHRDGFRGLYRGVVPALVQQIPLVGANFMFYKFFCELYTTTMRLESEKQIPGFCLVAIGGASGVTSKTLLYPFDLARRRLQIQGFGEHRKTFGTHFECTGLISCMHNTIKAEGLLGLYKGLWPSMMKSGLQNACIFAFYDQICRIIVKDVK